MRVHAIVPWARLAAGALLSACVWLMPSCAPAGHPWARGGHFDYTRVVRVELGLCEARYYDRYTGEWLKGLPIRPSGVFVPFGEGLCPASCDDKGPGEQGYIDRLGNWVIAPRFTEAGFFCGGRATVRVGNQTGVIDTMGHWVVKPGTYDRICPYRQGLASFRADRKWGFLGLDGEVVIPARYGDAWSFNDGLAVVQDERGWLCIDLHGKTRFRMPGEPPGKMFRNGLLLVDEATITGKGHPNTFFDDPVPKDGYLATSGQVAIPLQFDMGDDFSEGMAVVGRSETGIAAPNEKRTFFPPPEGEEFTYLVYGAIEVKGQVVIRFAYERLKSFSHGLAAFRLGGKWGYLDRHGKEVIPARFDRAEPFFDGLAEVVINGNVVIIDMSGRVVIRTGVEWVEM